MYWLAAALAVLAAGAAFMAHSARSERRALLGTETSSAADLRALHEAATAAAGHDTFRQKVELKGSTGAHVDGLLTSELTDTACVWYRQKVTRKYEEVRRGSGDERDTVQQKEEVVADNHSTQAFFVVDETGRIPVVPGKSVSGARKVLSEFRPAGREDSATRLELGSFKVSLPSSRQGGTLGYEYEEWVLPERVQVFVCGEAVDRGGRLSVREPEGADELVITTRSEEDLLAGTEKQFRLGVAVAVAAAVGAVGVLVYALVA